MLKEQIKTHFSGLYSLGRTIRDASKNNKKLKETARLYQVSHKENVDIDAPLSTIVVNDGPKRLNLIFAVFDNEALNNKRNATFLKLGSNFAYKNNFALRIVSRNNLPNGKVFLDFLKSNSIETPKEYSFYTDSDERVSGNSHRLSVTKKDVFFSEKELTKLEEWTKHGK